MRTTVVLDEDVVRAVEQVRDVEGLGLSAALNALVRRGLARDTSTTPRFVQRTSSLGRTLVPLDDIGSALELLEDGTHSG